MGSKEIEMTSQMIQTNEMATRPADAATILNQIGRWTLALVGARDFVSTGDGVMFKIGTSRKVIVKLGVLDLYAVEIVKINRRDWTFTSQYFADNLYADQLSQVIEKEAA